LIIEQIHAISLNWEVIQADCDLLYVYRVARLIQNGTGEMDKPGRLGEIEAGTHSRREGVRFVG
jgi:hypothetical protein